MGGGGCGGDVTLFSCLWILVLSGRLGSALALLWRKGPQEVSYSLTPSPAHEPAVFPMVMLSVVWLWRCGPTMPLGETLVFIFKS